MYFFFSSDAIWRKKSVQGSTTLYQKNVFARKLDHLGLQQQFLLATGSSAITACSLPGFPAMQLPGQVVRRAKVCKKKNSPSQTSLPCTYPVPTLYLPGSSTPQLASNRVFEVLHG